MAQRFNVQQVTSAVAAAIVRGDRATGIVSQLAAGQLDGAEGATMTERTAWRYIRRARQRLSATPAAKPERGAFLAELAERTDREPEAKPAEPARMPVSAPQSAPAADPSPSPVPPPPPSPRDVLIDRVVAVLAAGRGGEYAKQLRAYLRTAGNDAGLVRRLERLESQNRDHGERLAVLRGALKELRPPEPVRRRRARDRHRPLPPRPVVASRYGWEAMTGTRRLASQ